MKWSTADLDAIEAMETGESLLLEIPDLYRRFMLSVLNEMDDVPPMLDGLEDDPPTDERLDDWIHGARAALLFPEYECPGGNGNMEWFVAEHVVADSGDGGALPAGTTVIDMFSEVRRNDPGLSLCCGGAGVYLPAGNWHIDYWHTIRSTAALRIVQPGIYWWAVPSPQNYSWGGMVVAGTASHTLTLSGGADLSLENTWPVQFVIWANSSLTQSDALGEGVAGRESVFGRIVITRNAPDV